MNNDEDIAAFLDEIAKKTKALSDAELQGWLELDTWTVDEGLLLIVGIDPEAAVVEWGGWVSGYGCKINKVRIRNARPLSRHPVFLFIPTPKFPQFAADEVNPEHLTVSYDVLPDAQEEEVKWEKLAILQELEKKLSRVHNLWISGQHNAQRYPVAYFIEWAEKKDIEIPWLSHAREMKWLQCETSYLPDGFEVNIPPKTGRPETVKKIAGILRQIISTMTINQEIYPGNLPGSAADLLDACQRIEKEKTGNTHTFSKSKETFKTWLVAAGYRFGNGRTPNSEEFFWTKLCVETMGLIQPEIFTDVANKKEP